MKHERPAAAQAPRGAALFACAMVLGPGVALSQEVSLALTAGAAYSDNVNRVDVGEESDTAVSAGLRFAIDRAAGRLATDATADLRYQDYLDNTYADEVVGALAATLVYAFAPDRFTWTLQDNFGQTVEDRRFAETPDNRQSTNYFTTGPDWYVPLGARTQLVLQARWSDASYEETEEADSERYSGTIGLVRALDPDSAVSLNAFGESVDYEDDPAFLDPDYDTVSGYLGYRTQGARTSVDLQAGYTTMDGAARSYDGPLVNLNVTRELSARSTLVLDLGTNLTDAAEVFRRDQNVGGVDQGSETVIVSRDPMQATYASLGLTLAGSRTTVQIGADWNRDDQENLTGLDQERYGASITVIREISPRLEGRLSGGYSTEEIQLGADFDEWSVGVGLQWAVTEKLSLSLVADRTEGSGDSGPAEGDRDYVENRVGLFVAYTPRP
jgi:hypothetical protein